MSKRKKKPFKKQKPRELSIARALTSFPPDEEASLCVYLESFEKSRREGHITSWSLSHGAEYSLGVVDANGETWSIDAPTLQEGTKALSRMLIDAALTAGFPNPSATTPRPRHIEKHELPPRPDDRSEEEWNQLVNQAFALSADLLTDLNARAIARQVGPDAAAASLYIAIGRLSGRYAFRNVPREELWAMVSGDHVGKPMFMLGFNEERRQES